MMAPFSVPSNGIVDLRQIHAIGPVLYDGDEAHFFRVALPGGFMDMNFKSSTDAHNVRYALERHWLHSGGHSPSSSSL